MIHLRLLPRTVLILGLVACLLAACAQTQPPPLATPAYRIAAECRLLDRAAERMTAQGTPPHAGLTEGCPGRDTRDTRPLAQQSASLRAANAAPLPQGVAAGSRAETVFRRMITRGVSVEVATAIAATDDFVAATR